MPKVEKILVGKRRSSAERRERQAMRIIRILRVHRLTNRGRKVEEKRLYAIGRALGVSIRTVYYDCAILRKLYSLIGSDRLDP